MPADRKRLSALACPMRSYPPWRYFRAIARPSSPSKVTSELSKLILEKAKGDGYIRSATKSSSSGTNTQSSEVIRVGPNVSTSLGKEAHILACLLVVCKITVRYPRSLGRLVKTQDISASRPSSSNAIDARVIALSHKYAVSDL